MTEHMEQLKQEIKQLEKNMGELYDELKSTKDLVKKHNELRENIIDLSERLNIIETKKEEEERQKALTRKDKRIRQEWIVIFISAVTVLITFINVFWG